MNGRSLGKSRSRQGKWRSFRMTKRRPEAGPSAYAE